MHADLRTMLQKSSKGFCTKELNHNIPSTTNFFQKANFNPENTTKKKKQKTKTYQEK